MGNFFAVYALLICLDSFLTTFGADLTCGQLRRSEKCIKVELKWGNFSKDTKLLSIVCPDPSRHDQAEQIDNKIADLQLPKLSKQTALTAENKHLMKMLLVGIDSVQALQHGEHQLKVVTELGWRVHNGTLNLTPGTSESHVLSISSANDSSVLETKIVAISSFGARHDFETLSQLTVYNNISGGLDIVRKMTMADGSQTLCRGQLWDTSRNVFCVNLNKRIQDDMVQLNVLHGFITDKLSFPLENKSRSEMRCPRVFLPQKVCTRELVIYIVNYARAPGIRVMPEFSASTHAGEGRQHKDVANSCCQPCSENPEKPSTTFCNSQPAKGPSSHDYLDKYRHNFQLWFRTYNLRILENLKHGLSIIISRHDAWYGGTRSDHTYGIWSSLQKFLKCVWKSLSVYGSLPLIAQNCKQKYKIKFLNH